MQEKEKRREKKMKWRLKSFKVDHFPWYSIINHMGTVIL